jgi:Transposase DDE domain group 1
VLVQIVPSTRQLTVQAGLVLVRELADALGVAELLDQLTVKMRRRGFSPAQQTLGPFERALDRLFAFVDPLLERQTVTLDLDATLVEEHGPPGSRQGARGTYTGRVAWHPLLCCVGETGEWLPGKLRNGDAAAPTGAARFLRECLRRVPGRARIFLRADEGFWGRDVRAELGRRGITYAVGAPQIASVKARIAAVAAADWRPSSYRAGSEVAGFDWQPKTWKRSRRFIVRRDPIPTGEQPRLDASGDYHDYVLVTNDHGRNPDELERWHRAKANVETGSRKQSSGSASTTCPAAASTPTRPTRSARCSPTTCSAG